VAGTNLADDAAFQMLHQLLVGANNHGARCMCGTIQRRNHGPYAEYTKNQKKYQQADTLGRIHAGLYIKLLRSHYLLGGCQLVCHFMITTVKLGYRNPERRYQARRASLAWPIRLASTCSLGPKATAAPSFITSSLSMLCSTIVRCEITMIVQPCCLMRWIACTSSRSP